MKLTHTFTNLMLAATGIIGLLSCAEDRMPEYLRLTARDQWIDSLMRQEYLWYANIPAEKNLNYFLEPDKFLKSLLNPSEDLSYSSIETLPQKEKPSYGFHYKLVRDEVNDTILNALITYTLPVSPATRCNLQRGEWIRKINGQFITRQNEKQLLQGTGALTLTMGKYERKATNETNSKEIGIITETDERLLDAAEVVEESPINHYEVITTTQGTKVGYLVYNEFLSGTEADPEKYNNELRQLSQFFTNEEITHFILDLRYNRGNDWHSAHVLASLLAPEVALGYSFAKLEYNDKNAAKNVNLQFDNNLIGDGINMNIQQGVVISGNETSGVVGNWLNCMSVLNCWAMVGSQVKCPGVNTETFTNETFQFIVRPVVCTVYNYANESGQHGVFKPNKPAEETEDYTTFLPFGHKKEALLETALQLIEGK